MLQHRAGDYDVKRLWCEAGQISHVPNLAGKIWEPQRGRTFLRGAHKLRIDIHPCQTAPGQCGQDRKMRCRSAKIKNLLAASREAQNLVQPRVFPYPKRSQGEVRETL